MEHIALVEAANLVRTVELLKQAGVWVFGLEAHADRNLWDADLTGRTALVIGSEGKGIRRLVRARCDFLLRIPLHGRITSLNASASAAIALAECLRQRSSKTDAGQLQLTP
jgi:23S rRNA (guanosine2251-2'-O)-methyltransferase